MAGTLTEGIFGEWISLDYSGRKNLEGEGDFCRESFIFIAEGAEAHRNSKNKNACLCVALYPLE
jgi:hypothetical protein